MIVTDVRIKLASNHNLRAFVTIVLDDCLVITDLRLIEGNNGYFLAMPEARITDRCPKCRIKNYLTARYCSHCGIRLNEYRSDAKRFAPIVHPTTIECREELENAVIDAYEQELIQSRLPGYVSSYDRGYNV